MQPLISNCCAAALFNCVTLQLAFGTEEGDLYVISLSDGAVVNAFEGHEGEVTSMLFDGEFLFSGSTDCTVR
jgi:WD40 repeat protein